MRSALLVGAVVLMLGCPPPPCDRSSCSGCCDSAGLCLGGTSRAFCGGGGVQCQACGSGRRCLAGACVAGMDAGTGSNDAGPCPCRFGCCGSDACQPGNLPEACGVDGGACVACEAQERCDMGRCVSAPCTGCVDALGACRTGFENTACGGDGGLCAGCAPSEQCVARQCVGRTCSSMTCPSGCCLGGLCYQASPQTCGVLGAACVTCTPTQLCMGGVCR
ncbi:MAG: hypothetical protein SFW67_05370 [Myxococcaceae bacterium]|nr:hypothetical protein [Myxococcaceae bacterium]